MAHDTTPEHARRLDARTAVVVTGGDAPVENAALRSLLASVAPQASVVSADSGLEHAIALGLTVHHAVGDFDSVDPAVLARAEAGGVEVTRHPVDKEATDLELALDTAVALGALRVVVIGGHGGRLDHLLANCLALAAPRYANLVVDAVMGEATVAVARPWATTTFAGRLGETVTLLPVHGPAEGISTAGLRFPLRLETLVEGSTRGVSNEMVADRAEVRLTAGCLLVIRPGHLAPRPATAVGPRTSPAPPSTPAPEDTDDH